MAKKKSRELSKSLVMNGIITKRFSSTKSNLSNVPKGSEEANNTTSFFDIDFHNGETKWQRRN